MSRSVQWRSRIVGAGGSAAKKRKGAIVSLAILVGASLVTVAAPPAPRLLWNISPSAPVGLYLVQPGRWPRRGDRVVAQIPEPLRTLAARRRYLPANVPLVKTVVASSGDRVCAIGPAISINGRVAAYRHRQDAAGSPMPWWSGCIRLPAKTLFMLIGGQSASFDGRYIGPTRADHVVGRATLLWAR